MVATLGQQFHRVGGQQLIVADRRRDRAAAGAPRREARLHIIVAVAAGLERIDPDDLVPGQPFRGRRSHIGSLEFDLRGRALRRELEMLRGGLDEIRRHRNVFRRTRSLVRLRFGFRIHRPLRASVDRRLLQHIIIGGDLDAVPSLGIADLALFAHRTPIGGGIFFERSAGLLVVFQTALVLRHCGRREQLRQLQLPGSGFQREGRRGRDARTRGKRRNKQPECDLIRHAASIADFAPRLDGFRGTKRRVAIMDSAPDDVALISSSLLPEGNELHPVWAFPDLVGFQVGQCPARLIDGVDGDAIGLFAGGGKVVPGGIDGKTARLRLGRDAAALGQGAVLRVHLESLDRARGPLACVEEAAIGGDVDVGGPRLVLEAFGQRAHGLLLLQRTGGAVEIKHPHRSVEFVDQVDVLPIGMENEVARPGFLADLDRGRIVRRQLSGRPIEPEVEHGVGAEVARERIMI